MNPLADLCTRMGLVPESAAKLAGISPAAARDALAAQPPPAVIAYLAIADAIGAKLRLRAAPQPLSVWLDLAHLDALYADAAFRAGRDLPPLPPTRGALRAAVVDLRSRGRKSLGEIVEHLECGHVPTTEGLPGWRRSTVKQHLDSYKRRRGEPLPDDDKPLAPAAEAIERWRDYLVTGLLTEVCPADPFWCVRYQCERRQDGGRLVIEAKAPMPERVREWVLAGFTAAMWLAGQWGGA